MLRRRTIRANGRRAAPKPVAEEGLPALRREEPWEPPSLRFGPTAWAKLLFLRDLGATEVGGFGVTADDDLLSIEDVQLVRQVCTGASVAFDDQAVAEFFDRQVDSGRRPEQFARLWVHTHPGNFATPSDTDEQTFGRVFGRTDWAVMFILARQGQTYARLRFHVGPGGEMEIPVAVDYSRPFPASDFTAWKEEYAACVQSADPRELARRDPFLPDGPISSLEAWDLDDWLFGRDDRAAPRQQTSMDEMEAHYAIG
jgi:hypothetical protein